MKYNKITGKIKKMLDENGLWYESFEHEPVRTSKEAAKTRPGYTLNQGAKAIVIRVKMKGGEKQFAMLVFPADRRFSTDKVKNLFKAKDIRFASKEEIESITSGVEPGGIPPFGELFGLKLLVDPSLKENKKIVFNAGDRGFSVAMKTDDYIKLSNAEVAEFV